MRPIKPKISFEILRHTRPQIRLFNKYDFGLLDELGIQEITLLAQLCAKNNLIEICNKLRVNEGVSDVVFNNPEGYQGQRNKLQSFRLDENVWGQCSYQDAVLSIGY